MKMVCFTLLLIPLILLAPSPEIAGDDADAPLSPEKTQLIYESLLPPEKEPSPVKESHKNKTGSPAKTAAAQTDSVVQAFRKCGITLHGQDNQWEFLYGGHQFFLLLNSEDSRLRLLTPLDTLPRLRAKEGFNESELFEKMLKANYSATGEARFCLNREVIWLACVRPLETPSEQTLLESLDQMLSIIKDTAGP